MQAKAESGAVQSAPKCLVGAAPNCGTLPSYWPWSPQGALPRPGTDTGLQGQQHPLLHWGLILGKDSKPCRSALHISLASKTETCLRPNCSSAICRRLYPLTQGVWLPWNTLSASEKRCCSPLPDSKGASKWQ